MRPAGDPRMAKLLAIVAVLLSFGAPARAQVDSGFTDSPRDVVNLNVETVRGMEQAADGTLWAINTHGSQIVHHMDLGAAPEQIFPTLHLPVAIALWREDFLVVAAAGAHALALHDRGNGDVLAVLPLPSEPADVVIDPDHDFAYVSCQGENVVVKVDLSSFTEIVRHAIPAERPRFLFFDRGAEDDPDDNVVFVASFVSGNNSSAELVGPGDVARIFDLDGLPLSAQLPDEDLFEIDTNSSSPTAAVAVKRRVGTLLTAHGRHPNGEYWALNTEAINKDPARQNEPLLKGDFARSRVWIGTPVATTPVSTTLPAELIDLDLPAGGGGYSAADSVAFPFGIAFEPTVTGRVFITSPLADAVSIRDAAGAPIGRIALPQGSIPFDVELDRLTGQLLFVYCWGTNEIRVIAIANPTIVFPLDLGIDPTPEPIRRGRTTWYDGHRSLNARSSCNTCHPGGKSDFLGWQISDHPTDEKDVMVTQSLLGIEDTYPFHWRGERALIDFNEAFVGLLGGPAPLSTVPIPGEPGIEFDDFQAFVFSLQPHANPFQDLSRLAAPTSDPMPNGLPGDAQAGEVAFNVVSGFLGRTCADCHIPQSGSNNDFNDENGFLRPSARHLEVPHLRELTHRDQPQILLTLGTVSTPVARSGFGTTHNGRGRNLFQFIAGGASFNLSPQQASDVTAFVRRFDQGIAPAAHEARLFDGQDATVDAFIQSTLISQASAGTQWIDLVAFGTFIDPSSGSPTVARWWFNPATGRFDCNDPAIASQPFSTFQVAGTSMVFLGLPPGNGFRFGLDPDNDGLIDGDEVLNSTLPLVPDTDGDGQPDGYEVLLGSNPTSGTSLGVDTTAPSGTASLSFVSSSMGKFILEADEEVAVSAQFKTLGDVTKTVSSPVLARRHTIALQGLVPSTESGLPGIPGQTNTAVAVFTLTDRQNNATPVGVNPFTPDEMILEPGMTVPTAPMVVASLSGAVSSGGTTRTILANVSIAQRHMQPGPVDPAAANNRMILFEPLVESPAGSGIFVAAVGTTTLGTVHSPIVTNQGPIGAPILPGTYIATPLTTTLAGVPGSASVDVTLSGLSVGQRVRLRVIAILEPKFPLQNPPTFIAESTELYQLPPTLPANRGLDLVVP